MSKKKEPKIYSPVSVKSKDGERYRCQIIYYVNDIQKKTWGDRCDTKEEAIKNAEMKLERLVYDIDLKPLHYTVADVANKYIEDKLTIPQTNAPSSVASDISNMRSAIFCENTKYIYTNNSFRNIKVSQLSSNMLNRWFNDLLRRAKQEELSVNRYKKLKGAMRQLIEYANDINCFKEYKDYVELMEVCNNKKYNISDPKSRRKNKKNRANRVISNEQFKQMITDDKYFFDGQFPMLDEIGMYNRKYKKFFMDSVYYHLFNVLFYTGIRMSEARPLRMNDVEIDILDVPICTIRINKSLAYKYPKGKRQDFKKSMGNPTKSKESDRYVFIVNSYVNLLDNYVSYMDGIYEQMGIENGLLFPTSDFEYLSDHAVDSKLQTWLKKLGDNRPEGFSKHDFRRTRITMMLNNGKTSQELIEYFGHSIKDIIDDYYDARKAEDKLKRAQKVIGKDEFNADILKIEQLEAYKKRYKQKQ